MTLDALLGAGNARGREQDQGIAHPTLQLEVQCRRSVLTEGPAIGARGLPGDVHLFHHPAPHHQSVVHTLFHRRLRPRCCRKLFGLLRENFRACKSTVCVAQQLCQTGRRIAQLLPFREHVEKVLPQLISVRHAIFFAKHRSPGLAPFGASRNQEAAEHHLVIVPKFHHALLLTDADATVALHGHADKPVAVLDVEHFPKLIEKPLLVQPKRVLLAPRVTPIHERNFRRSAFFAV